jgi:hypothetical protein
MEKDVFGSVSWNVELTRAWTLTEPHLAHLTQHKREISGHLILLVLRLIPIPYRHPIRLLYFIHA